AATWNEGATGIVQVEGPVVIELDRATLKAKQAVLWITEDPQAPDQRRAEVALLGDAEVKQPDTTRSAQRLYVTATIRGPIRITAEERQTVDRSGSPLYHAASEVRAAGRGPQPATAPATRPTTVPAATQAAPPPPAAALAAPAR